MRPGERIIIWTAEEISKQDTETLPFLHKASDVVRAINGVADVPEAVRAHFKYIMELPTDTGWVFVDAEAFAGKMRDLHKWASDGEKDFIDKIASSVRQVSQVPYVDINWDNLYTVLPPIYKVEKNEKRI